MSDLLCAQVDPQRICEIVGVCERAGRRIKARLRDGKTMERKTGSGGHNCKVTDDFLSELGTKINEDPTRSMRKLAMDLNVSKTTICKAVGMLGLHSYVRRRRQLLTKKTRESRVTRGKKLINWLKKKSPSTVLVFSDKKNWTVDQSRNARNDRYLAYCVEEVPVISQTKHPASSMRLGGVASDGKRMDREGVG